MRVACLQFEPVSGDVDDNISRADAVLSRINPSVLSSIDLLVLPELAFSGTLPSSENGGVERHYEHPDSGVTGLWARTFALKYNCFVVTGYPEKTDESTGASYYNSALVVDKEGDIIGNHRKCFLHSFDDSWASEGSCFFDDQILGLGKVVIGLSMDIKNRTSKQLNIRLEPIIRAESMEEVIVVICNRTGVEDDTIYSGTSCVMGIKEGEVLVYGLLGRGQKSMLLTDTDNDEPIGNLVCQNDKAASTSAATCPPTLASSPAQSTQTTRLKLPAIDTSFHRNTMGPMIEKRGVNEIPSPDENDLKALCDLLADISRNSGTPASSIS
ncbi:Protein N-terminal amidase [Diaporthe eres]|nr:Protein N-terminal amidase [Diaporthe eres]